MFCANCGREMKDGMKFCTMCGTPVTQPAPVVTSAPVPTPEAVAAPAPVPTPEPTPVQEAAPEPQQPPKEEAPIVNKKVPVNYRTMYTSILGEKVDRFIYLENDMNKRPVFEPEDGNNIITFHAKSVKEMRSKVGSYSQTDREFTFDVDVYITDSRVILNSPNSTSKKDPTKMMSGHIRYDWISVIAYENRRGIIIPEQVTLKYLDMNKTLWEILIEFDKAAPDCRIIANEIARRMSAYRMKLDYEKTPQEISCYNEILQGKQIEDKSQLKMVSSIHIPEYFYAPSGIGYSLKRHSEVENAKKNIKPEDQVHLYSPAYVIDCESHTFPYDQCVVTDAREIAIEGWDGQNCYKVPFKKIEIISKHPADNGGTKTELRMDTKDGFLFVSDSRLCLVVRDYTRGDNGRVFSSSLLADLAINGVLKAAEAVKAGNKVLASQIRYEWLHVARYERIDGKCKNNLLAFNVIDTNNKTYFYRLTLDKHTSPVEIANDICNRAASWRLNMTDEKDENELKVLNKILSERIEDDGVTPDQLHGFKLVGSYKAPHGKKFIK